MWNIVASSKYLEHKYNKDNLHRHYANLYDIGVNYHVPRRKPVPNVPDKKGRFLIEVEKDAKQKNFRKAFIKNENKKLINKINEINTKNGRLSKKRLDPAQILPTRSSINTDKITRKRASTKPTNPTTLKRQLWSNKNMTNY